MSFMTADQAKILSDVANINIEMFKPRLAQLIEDNARQGNTAVLQFFPSICHWKKSTIFQRS